MISVEPGSLWQHHSGRLYMVLFLTNDIPDRGDGKYPRTVVYIELENGRRWSGPLDDWARRMTLVAK